MLVNAHTVIHNVTGIIEGKLKSTMNNAKMLAIQRRIESEVSSMYLGHWEQFSPVFTRRVLSI